MFISQAEKTRRLALVDLPLRTAGSQRWQKLLKIAISVRVHLAIAVECEAPERSAWPCSCRVRNALGRHVHAPTVYLAAATHVIHITQMNGKVRAECEYTPRDGDCLIGAS